MAAAKKFFIYSSKFRRKAVPLRTQYSGGFSVGRYTATTKLVDIPVVDKVPFRTEVLYTGQAYSCFARFAPDAGRK